MPFEICPPNPVSTLQGQNQAFITKINTASPGLLSSLADKQCPPILWIGCSDSRVPETTLLNLQPGDVFVHRNIANIITAGDTSVQSVITYAVEHLKVKCIIVCGHSACGGVSAVIEEHKFVGPLEAWLEPLRKLKHDYAGQYGSLDESVSLSERVVSLARFNIQAARSIVSASSVVQEARKVRQVDVLAAIYHVGKGELEFFM